MLEVIKTSPHKRTIVLRSQRDGYCGWWNFPIFFVGVIAAFLGLAFVGSVILTLGRKLPWEMLGGAGVLGSVATLIYWHTKSLPVEETTLVLEPQTISLVKERLSQPDFEVLQRTTQVVEIGSDCGVVLTNLDDDDRQPGIQIWGNGQTLLVSAVGSANKTTELALKIERWIERRKKQMLAVEAAATQQGVNLPEASSASGEEITAALAALADSKWVSVSIVESEPATLRISLRPSGPEASRFHKLPLIGWAMTIGGIVMLYYTGEWFFWIWTGGAAVFAIMITVAVVFNENSAVCIDVTRQQATRTIEIFGTKWVKRLDLDPETNAGLLNRASDNGEIIPALGIQSGDKTIEFGTFLNRDDKQALLKLLRLFLLIDRHRNVFLGVRAGH